MLICKWFPGSGEDFVGKSDDMQLNNDTIIVIWVKMYYLMNKSQLYFVTANQAAMPI
jgi:hypothetical protein